MPTTDGKDLPHSSVWVFILILELCWGALTEDQHMLHNANIIELNGVKFLPSYVVMWGKCFMRTASGFLIEPKRGHEILVSDVMSSLIPTVSTLLLFLSISMAPAS